MVGTGGDEVVRCLACGCEYELPDRAETAEGCPRCGDPSWIALAISPRRKPPEVAELRKIHLHPVS